MKKVIFTLPFIFCVSYLFAQNASIEQEIRRLEQSEVQAILDKDTVTLAKLWDRTYVVNSPNNTIVLPGKTVVDRPVLKNSRTSFTREIEEVFIRGNVVFSMGNETVTMGDQTQIVKRRFTNIWMKIEDKWKLVARHANIICSENKK